MTKPATPDASAPDPATTGSRRWHHRPEHLFVPDATYIVTARTRDKAHFFAGGASLRSAAVSRRDSPCLPAAFVGR